MLAVRCWKSAFALVLVNGGGAACPLEKRLPVLNVGFAIDLISHTLQTSGSVSAADLLAYGRGSHFAGPTWLFTGSFAVLIFVYAYASSGAEPRWRSRRVAVVVGGLLLILSLILLTLRPEWQV
jgi:hypothetical protein